MTLEPRQRFERIEQLFRSASALPSGQREAFLRQQCSQETSVCDQVLSMLQADERPAIGVLDRPALGDDISVASMVAETVASESPPPERIGRYRILRVIGEGGMGVVYEAQQDEPRRSVALKVIRPGMVTRQLLQRFRHEAQVLGQLMHPGIAQIYEAGSADTGQGGQPYFAMELVEGAPLLEYAQEHRLNVRDRLRLMADICDALHHAHQRGVVHRDLKPANILVVDSAAQGKVQPKVLDFGVARATDGDIQTVTLQTDAGQLIGTVPYMSPEQAAGDPSAIDIRSDVYSLGVILFELLTGRLPYDLRGKMIHEAVRVIREDDPTHLSSIDRVFRGDVDTILCKALEKEKDRRYQSASDLAADIRRHLSDEPIAARPATTLYQIRKFARRNKAVVGGVVIAFAALTIGTGISITQAVVARASAAEARRQAYRASLVAASSALRYHETNDAQRHLEAAPQELRGWEWDHLASRLDDTLMTLHTEFSPTCLAISPDGQTLASCGSGGHIRLWHLPDLELVATRNLTGSFNQRRVKRLVFSSDGRELRADNRAGSIRLDALTLAEIARDDLVYLERSPANEFGVALSIGQERRLVFVEIATGREVAGVSCRDGMDGVIKFSPDGAMVAVCLPDKGLSIHNTLNGELLWQRAELNQILDMAFAADGTRIALASANGAVAVLETKTGSELAAMVGHAVSVAVIAFSPDETLIATASGDRTVRLWRADDGSPVALMHGSQGAVTDAAFTPDGAHVVTASADRKIRWWDATRAGDPFVLPTPGTVYGLGFSPDGGQLVAACLGGERPLRVWDLARGAQALATGEGFLSALAISRDGKLIAVGRSGTTESTIYNADGSELMTVDGHWWRTNWLAFSNDGQRLLSLGNGGRLLVHDLSSGKPLHRKDFPPQTAGEGCRAVFNPDGSLMAVASGRTIHLLDATSWQLMSTFQADRGMVYALAFSPDGARLVSGSSDAVLRVWDVVRQTLTAELASHSSEIYAVLFSPDGSRLFSAGRDRVVRVWDAERWEEITQLHGHTSLIYCLAFSPDARTLASGGGDGVRVWSTAPLRQQRSASASAPAAN